MRKILFRGKTLATGDWEYGAFVKFRASDGNVFDAIMQECNGEHLSSEVYSIRSETLGQYTGVNDRDGEEIFEGDIVDCGGMIGIVEFGMSYDDAKFYIKFDKKHRTYINGLHFWTTHEGENQLKVIGNIWDNPELLKGDYNE